MSISKTQKKKLQKECLEGDQDACATLGSAEAEKKRGKFFGRSVADKDASPMIRWLRFGLATLFWAGIFIVYVFTILGYLDFEYLWLTTPFLLAFGVLMVKGEQLESKAKRIFWVAGILLTLTMAIFIGYFLFFSVFDFWFLIVWASFLIIMVLYIIIRAVGGDARAGVLTWIILITSIVSIATFATAVSFWYLEMFFEMIILLWAISGILMAATLILVAITLLRMEKPK